MLGRMRKIRELRSQLFSEMSERFGVKLRRDYGTVEGTMVHTAVARCFHCTEAARCRDWLANTTGTDGAAEFCPNAAVFASLGKRMWNDREAK